MKTICFFAGDITRAGGTEKVTTQIANGLCLRYKVIILSLKETMKDTFFVLDKNIEHFSVFQTNYSTKRDYIKIVLYLHNFIKNKNVDVVINTDTMLDIYTVFAKRFTKAKAISWEHFNFYETLGNKYRMFVRKHVTKYSDCVVTLTKEDKENYKKYFGKKLRVYQIYNPFIRDSISNDYDINSRTIISVGRLVSLKGYDMMIKVAEKVMHARPKWKWLILGDGEKKECIINDIKKHNLSNVQLVGRVENVNDYLRESAIFVMTSRNEGFPLSMVEAKSCNLPIISFNCKTGPKELVSNGVNGWLIDCFDIEDMSLKLANLMDDIELRKEFSSKAYLGMENLEYKHIIKCWIDLIESLI